MKDADTIRKAVVEYKAALKVKEEKLSRAIQEANQARQEHMETPNRPS